MSADPVLLVAASGLAREAASAAWRAGQQVIGCLDDDESRWGTEVAPGLRVVGGLVDVADHPGAGLVVCAGRGAVRAAIVERLERQGITAERFTTVVDPAAALAPDTVLGPGSIVLAGVVATAAVTLGPHVVCMPNVVLTHDDVVEAYATLCAGVVLGGTVTVGRAAYVGMAAAVREGCTVGAGATVGMGAVVVTDVPPGQVWAGVPARPLPEPG